MVVIESPYYIKWKRNCKSRELVQRINARIRWIQKEERFVGDHKALRQGITELRFHFGPGYRVYVSREREGTVLLLLVGGNKNTQQKDIDKAIKLAEEWRKEYE